MQDLQALTHLLRQAAVQMTNTKIAKMDMELSRACTARSRMRSPSSSLPVPPRSALKILAWGVALCCTQAQAQTVTSTGDVVPVQVPNPSPSWNAGTTLHVGSTGTGTLTMDSGGSVTHSGVGTVGYDLDSNGTVTVRGPGSTWNGSSSLVIGGRGTGTLKVEDGGVVSGVVGALGDVPEGVGTATISGTGSAWRSTQDFFTSFNGTGTVTVRDGGALSVQGGAGTITMDADPGAVGTLQVGGGPADAAMAPGVVDAARIDFSLGTGTLHFNHTGANLGFALALSSVDPGTHRITHQAGTTTLSADSSGFSGSTAVSGGRLVVANALGGTASVTGGQLDVDGTQGGTITASGSGVVTGAGTVSGDLDQTAGGVLLGQQGRKLSVAGLATLGGGAVVQAGLGAPSATALFDVNGNLTLGGTLGINDLGGFGAGVYRLFDYRGTLAGSLAFGALPPGVVADNLTLQTSVPGQVNLLSTVGVALGYWDGGNAALRDNNVVNGGTGVWRADGRNWTGAGGALNGPYQPNPTVARFQGLAGVVTADAGAGAIGITGMQFDVDGYRLQGATLGLQGAGANTVNVASGATATVALVLSGPGGLAKAGAGTLVLEAAGSYGGATTVQGGSLRAGAANVLTSVSAHEVQASGVLDLDGLAQTVASLVNAGTVRLPRNGAPAVPGTTLSVTGNYSGGGVLAMATQLGNEASPSDRLVVNGSVTAGAPTRLDIANAAGLGAATAGNGILVVQVNGAASPAGAFVLAAPLQTGGYSYQLVQVGSHWYLQSRLAGATGVQQIPALGTAGLAGLALMLGGLAAWRQRRRPGAVRG